VSRSIGAFAVFTPSALPEEIQKAIDRTTDLSPVLGPIAKLMLADGRAQLAAGEGWPPLAASTLKRKARAGAPATIGIGVHGGFGPTMIPFFSARNAGWKTRAPHAHLFEYGTDRYRSASGERTTVWGEGGRHHSRGTSRRRLAESTAATHQPARPFAFISDQLHERANEMITAFIVAEFDLDL
jgi:hypothetical protein